LTTLRRHEVRLSDSEARFDYTAKSGKRRRLTVRDPQSVRVRQVSAALGNTPAVARASYIDPRIVELYEEGKVIELPTDLPYAAVPLRIEAGRDGVIIELPTDVDGNELRMEVERRVRELLQSAAYPSPRPATQPSAF
jgi:hypothetical protein